MTDQQLRVVVLGLIAGAKKGRLDVRRRARECRDNGEVSSRSFFDGVEVGYKYASREIKLAFAEVLK